MQTIISKVRSHLRKRGYDIVKHRELSEWLALHEIDIVLDIGANNGGYATEVRATGWRGDIVSFEPNPEVFSRLVARMGNDPAWSGRQIGLGNEDTVLKLNVSEMDVLSSFLKKKEDLKTFKEVSVPVKCMEGIIDEVLGSHKRPFVKIDTQGFEMEIIRGFGSRINDVIGWQLELSVQPLYEGQPLMEEVIATMRSLGFSLWKILPGLRDPATLQAFELDGIFFQRK